VTEREVFDVKLIMLCSETCACLTKPFALRVALPQSASFGNWMRKKDSSKEDKWLHGSSTLLCLLTHALEHIPWCEPLS
jgi:hypothetical protein